MTKKNNEKNIKLLFENVVYFWLSTSFLASTISKFRGYFYFALTFNKCELKSLSSALYLLNNHTGLF